ncbi:hypothetical protein QYF36_004037 [Acer negundo]|nr:hypothetical protein QYF36_004037 [Acer negundo]
MAMSMLKLVFALMTLFSVSTHSSIVTGTGKEAIQIYPPTCTRIECPNFKTIHVGNGFEIRRYNSSVWITTSPIQDISLVQATRTGFLQLFDYIQGKNKYNQTIAMTAPVITQILPSDGPFCKSTFNVSFYVPKENQADPPPAEGLQVQRWKLTYLAARQFSGFVEDSSVGKEAAALKSSLEGTVWADAIQKNLGDGVYTVAQYNSPFEFENRVNEIWMTFHIEDQHALL